MLKPCDKEGCFPMEQIRGEMGPGDYYDVMANNRIAVPGAVMDPEKYGFPLYTNDIPEGIRAEHCVEMNNDMKGDFRICCKTCGKATPWGANDIPGMLGAGADWTRKRWNEAA